jgi:hypothetical protein
LVPDVLPPLITTVDEPSPARKANTMPMTMIMATVSVLTPQRVAAWGVKFYLSEQPSDSGGVGGCSKRGEWGFDR